jgi:hypothetical protein
VASVYTNGCGGLKTAGRGASRSWWPCKRGTHARHRHRCRHGSSSTHASPQPHALHDAAALDLASGASKQHNCTARPRRHPRRPRRPRPRRVTGGGSARACNGAPRASSRSAEREPPTNRAFQFRLQYEKVDSTSSRSRLRTSRFMMASISAPWRRPWPPTTLAGLPLVDGGESSPTGTSYCTVKFPCITTVGGRATL